MSGNAPTVPADTSLALMVAGARRPLRPAAAATATVAATASPTTTVEAEKMTLSGAGRAVADRTASAGYAAVLSGPGSASAKVNLPASTQLTIRARAGSISPNMTVAIDGVPVTTLLINSTSYSNYTFAGAIAAGTHVISVSTTTATTRNTLYLDTVATATGPIVDEFLGASGAAPSSAIWTARAGTGFDSGIQTYATGNAVLDGQGHLVLRASRATNGGYTSGEVWTKNNVSFGYGTITARIKMPAGQGLWPSFFLLGANSDTVGWPQSGEIDVVELPSTTTKVYSTLHGPITGSTGTQQAQLNATMPDLSTGYHNYWVNHLPNQITFGVDKITLGTLTPASLAPGSQWVYNQPMYAVMSLAAGGPWAGTPNSSTPFPAQMIVDSVRWDPPA